MHSLVSERKLSHVWHSEIRNPQNFQSQTEENVFTLNVEQTTFRGILKKVVRPNLQDIVLKEKTPVLLFDLRKVYLGYLEL